MTTIAKSIAQEDTMMPIHLSIDDQNIAWMVFDLPNEKINKLSRQVFEKLQESIDELRKQKRVKALIIKSAKPDIFIAGADISEIANVTDRDEAERMSGAAQLILNNLEDLKFPTIAAIHGACLGGGLELALACDFRLATDHPKTKLGQPEVNLGIIPGAGGTQRLPRLVGLQRAIDLICSGRTIDSRQAKRMGLIDKTAPAGFLDEIAKETALELMNKRYKRRLGHSSHFDFSELIRPVKLLMNPGKLPEKTASFFLEDTPIGRRVLFMKAKENVLKKTSGHYPAPIKAIEAIQASLSSAKKGFAKEASIFGELAVSETCKNLIRVFFASEAIKKDPGVKDAKSLKPLDIQRSAILGAGLMGGGIAQLLAHNGIRVRMKDINNKALLTGFRAAADIFFGRVRKGSMSKRELRHKMALISGTVQYSGFKNIDLVIEAVLEDLNLKRLVLREAEEKMPAKAIFASNTSSLSITEIGAGSKVPQRVIGMHFFNPVHRMPLVEVIPGNQTSDETIASIVALSKRLGKIPVVVGDGPGFLVNRVLGIYLNEAAHLFEEGMDIETIDEAMLKFGMPMGPFRLLDEIGIEVAAKAAKVLRDKLGERFAGATLLDTVLHDGRRGRLSGQGFYVYESKGEGGKNVDRSVYDLWPSRKSRSMPRDVLIDRMVLSMVNEAVYCLTEGIARNSRDVDIAMVMGTGFPAFRGGLIHYANSIGLAKVVERLNHFQATVGPRFQPHERLVSLAKENGTL